MASLNTLRTKFGIVLSIVIGLALLAFVLSLKTEMGFSGNDPRVGVINGDKINYSEYINEYEKVKQNTGASEGDENQANMLSNATWQSLLANHVMFPGFENLGIVVSEPERIAIISGDKPSQTLFSAFGDPRTGTYNVEAVNQFLVQAETNPQAQQAWANLNEQLKMERLMQKYASLVKGGAYINNLEVAHSVAAANNTFTGKWASKKYSDVPDSLMKISSSDIKSYYKNHKELFKQNPSRTISYVVFDVTPTSEDMSTLESQVMEVGNEFVATQELKTYVRNNRNGTISEAYVPASQLSEEEAVALTAGNVYGPALKNNVWTMSRVVDTKLVSDSLGVKHIVLPYNQEALADSLINVLKGGADFAALAAQYSVYDATAANGGEVGVLPYSAFTGEFATALANAKVNDVVKIAAGDAIQIMKVYRATPPVKHMQIASITYPVEASVTTKRDIHNNAGEFLVGAADGSIEAFNEAATAAAVTPRIATMAQGERSINGLEDSREIARWAYEAKKDEVSQIFNVGNDYVIAILTDIDDDEYASVEKSASQIKSALMRDKKYDYIAQSISGATIDEQAQSLGSQVAAFDNTNYVAFYVDGMGIEPRVIGAIAATKDKGVVSKPIKGAAGVYVFVVDDIVTTQTQTADAEKVRAQATVENMTQQLAMPAIMQMSNIKDLRGKYF